LNIFFAHGCAATGRVAEAAKAPGMAAAQWAIQERRSMTESDGWGGVSWSVLRVTSKVTP
jgi:hypothetical protein